MILLFVLSLEGILLCEFVLYSFKSNTLNMRWKNITNILAMFFEARHDDERQRLILLSSLNTFIFSLLLLGIVVALAMVVWLPIALLEFTKEEQIIHISATSVVALLWWTVRPKVIMTLQIDSSSTALVVSHGYSLLERGLHWLVLEHNVVRRLAFDLERHFFLPKHATKHATDKTNSVVGAVYVCGLARSGTTILLQILDQTGIFRSLNYRDMPFVMAPTLWKSFAKWFKKDILPSERAHGDNMIVGVDSPEAFEDVFWETFRIENTHPRCFDNPLSEEALAAFADYRSIVANSKSDIIGISYRYLSKNNNNLIRLESLSQDPTGTLLLVYRDPINTAYSLFKQHQRFCVAQQEDPFIKQYMTWLAHHEFGLGHKPFCFAVAEMNPDLTPDDPNYWLDYWQAVYLHVLTKQNLRMHLIDHDALCTQPIQGVATIFNQLGLDVDPTPFAKAIRPPRNEVQDIAAFDPRLIEKVKVTHAALRASGLNIIKTEKV